MSDAVSPHGFTVSRRGYETNQVEQAIDEVTTERDRAWQRLADLGEQVRGLEQQLADAVRAVAEAGPPAFAELGEGAVRLLALAEEEASRLAAESARLTEQQTVRSRGDVARLSAGTRDYATRLCAEADEAYRRELEWAQEQAGGARAEAEREAAATGAAADAEVAAIGARAETLSREAQDWLTGQQHAADQAEEAQEARLLAWEQEITAGAQRKLGEGERHLKAMQARAADVDADAATQAERTVEAAHREAARIASVTEREQAVFAERRGELQAHLDHIRDTLTALTGAAPAAEAADAEAGDGEAEQLSGPVLDPDATTVLPQAVDNAPAAPAEEG